MLEPLTDDRKAKAGGGLGVKSRAGIFIMVGVTHLGLSFSQKLFFEFLHPDVLEDDLK